MRGMVALSGVVLGGGVAVAEGVAASYGDVRPRLLVEARTAGGLGEVDAARKAGAALAWELERDGRGLAGGLFAPLGRAIRFRKNDHGDRFSCRRRRPE